jgi:hypothetical protein
MRNTLLALAVATAALIGGASAASAFERNFTIDTNRGQITGSSEVYCFAGACYREAQLTGVNGNTLETSGMCVRATYYRWNCKGTVTGPEGNSATRRFHVHVY